MRGFFGRGVYNGIETQPDRAVRPGARELDRVADGDHPKHGAKLSPQRAAPPRHAVYPGGHTGAGRLPRGSDFAGGAQRRRPCRTGPPLARDRALLYRKYYYLQSTAQIAAELGMTARAVEGRLYRLKKQLRRMLGGEGHV